MDTEGRVKGAAIAAGIGGALGLLKQSARNQRAVQAQAARSNYDRAYAACLEGRGYQVR